MADREGEKLDRLIRRRRRELGLVPCRWRVLFSRLVNLLAAVGSVIL